MLSGSRERHTPVSNPPLFNCWVQYKVGEESVSTERPAENTGLQFKTNWALPNNRLSSKSPAQPEPSPPLTFSHPVIACFPPPPSPSFISPEIPPQKASTVRNTPCVPHELYINGQAMANLIMLMCTLQWVAYLLFDLHLGWLGRAFCEGKETMTWRREKKLVNLVSWTMQWSQKMGSLWG